MVNGKKIILKASIKNLNDDIKFRDYQIKKLEDEITMINKEYLDLYNRFSESERNRPEILPSSEYRSTNSSTNGMFSDISLKLKEENQALQKENAFLQRNLEILQNEINTKYVPKLETEKKMVQIESEANYLISKLRISEANVEKYRKQLQSLSIDQDELRRDLQESERKFDEYRTSYKHDRFDSNLTNRETPLNLITDESEEGEGEDGRRRKFTFSYLRRPTEKDVSRFSIKESENGGYMDENYEMKYNTGTALATGIDYKFNFVINLQEVKFLFLLEFLYIIFNNSY